MGSVIQWSLRFRLLVMGLATALLIVGAAQLRDGRVDVLPEYSPPYVEIQTEALGLSAGEVEQFITVPLEANLLANVAWVEDIESRSIPGLSSIVLLFEPGTDLLRARQMVQERLTEAHALPRVSRPPQMIQPLSSASRVMIVSLSSQERSLIDLSVLARWTIRPRLMGVPGVANVTIWGQREKQLQVQVDPALLADRGVTLDQIVRTTGNALWVSPLSYLNASTPGSGGFIDTPNQRLGVRHVLPIRTPEDLARVPLEGRESLRLGDISTVVEDHQPLIGDAGTDSGRSLLLVVEKLPGVTTLDVARDVEAALVAMQPGLDGVSIDPTIYRPATFVETAVTNLALSSLLAFLLIALVVGAFMLGWRTVVVSVVAMVLSLVSAALVLHVAGATVNALVVAGLVVALVVVLDDAVVDVEHVARRLRERAPAGAPVPARDVIAAATAEMRGPAFYALFVVILVVVPVVVLEGLTGAFLRPFAAAFVLAIVASMVVGLTVTPALAALLLRAEPGGRRSRAVGRLQLRYQGVLARSLRRPAPVLVGALLLAIVGVATVPQLARSFSPTFREGDLLVHMDAAPGTSHPAISRMADRATAELRSVPGVRRVGSHVGRAIMSDQVVNVSSGQLWISLEPSADHAATMAAIRAVLAGYPGLRLDGDSYISERAAASVPSPGDPVSVRVFGPDLDELNRQAEAVRAAIADVPGIVDPQVRAAPSEPVVEVTVDLDRAYEHGVKPGDVRRAAATLVTGLEVGNLFEDQKVFEVIVVGVPDLRHSLTSLNALGIDTLDGGQVALSEVADVHVVAAPAAIERAGISRYVDVVAGITGRDTGAVLADVQAAVGGLAFPLEYHPEVTSSFGESQAALQRMAGVVLAVVIAVFLLFQAAYGSWRLAALSMLTVPIGLAGGVIATFLAGGSLSLGSLIGFLAVLAITARHEIFLGARIEALRRSGLPGGPTLILRTARERVRPVLMTALAATLAMVPVLVQGARPGLEILYPMAIVIVGGLGTSLLVNLFIFPSIYLGLPAAPGREPARRRLPATAEPQPAGAR